MAPKTVKRSAEKSAKAATGRTSVEGRRRSARDAFRVASPHLQGLSVAALAALTSEDGSVGNTIKFVKAFLDDDDYAPADWLKDALALMIGHWSGPLEKVAGLFSSGGGGSQTPKFGSPHFLAFELDQHSEAADPRPIAVDRQTFLGIANGTVVAGDLTGNGHTIPAENVRLSVSGEQAFVSLVELDGLNLKPGTISGPLKVVRKGAKGPSAVKTVALARVRTVKTPLGA